MEEILSFKIDRVIGIDPSSMKRTLSRYVYPLSLFLSLTHNPSVHVHSHESFSFAPIEIRARKLDNTIRFIICRNWIILVDNVYGYEKQLSTYRK